MVVSSRLYYKEELLDLRTQDFKWKLNRPEKKGLLYTAAATVHTMARCKICSFLWF